MPSPQVRWLRVGGTSAGVVRSVRGPLTERWAGRVERAPGTCHHCWSDTVFCATGQPGPRGAAFSALLALQAGSRAGDRRGERLPSAGDVASTLFRGLISRLAGPGRPLARRASGRVLDDLDGLRGFPREFAAGDGAAGGESVDRVAGHVGMAVRT